MLSEIDFKHHNNIYECILKVLIIRHIKKVYVTEVKIKYKSKLVLKANTIIEMFKPLDQGYREQVYDALPTIIKNYIKRKESAYNLKIYHITKEFDIEYI